VYLNAIIDCCTREIVGWELSLRCRAAEAITVIETAVREQAIRPGTLTLGTDNGSAFTARATRLVLFGLGVTHRRGGYRDPESQAFIESWFQIPQGALRLAPRLRDARPGPGGDRRLHRALPRPAPQTGSTTEHPARNAPRGTMHKEHYKTSRPSVSTLTGSAPSKCVTATKKNRHKPACKLTVTKGTLSFTAHAGENKISFQGRISRSKTLKPGKYTLLITATNAAHQHSKAPKISFTIVK
ncbi:MAG: DDE-type integrase/transposase/recombinase, partial [Solirubrobacteraceae bacterium]